MRFQVLHTSKRTIRLKAIQVRMTMDQADLLEEYIRRISGVDQVTVHERTAGVIITHHLPQEKLMEALSRFTYEEAGTQITVSGTSRAISREYKEKIIFHVLRRGFKRLYLPAPIRHGIAVIKAVPYLVKAMKSLLTGRITVELLDGVAIGVSLLTGDYETASSVMFLLKLGDLMDEWTHKKSLDDLAQSMALNVDRVWMRMPNGDDVEVPVGQVQTDDLIIVDAGGVIPLDGEVTEGEASVNQATLTGESVPAAKTAGSQVFAGTVVEEGRLIIRVTKGGGANKYDQIVRMIEESEKLNSRVEARASNLADKLVPWSLATSLGTYLFSGNVTRAVSVLMVDFSCALKLAMPLSVLSAMQEAAGHKIVVKGGKFMEKVSEATTIIFDKTGTLTKACPTVKGVIPFAGRNADEMLRTAACLEEHFPHSMANAVIRAAKEKNLDHDEMHSQVEYIVAHGIATRIGEERAVIGSYHFVFEDEKASILPEDQAAFDALPPQYSQLYLAIGGILSTVILIADPLRPEAKQVVERLHQAGFTKTVMLTGDSDRTARAMAQEAGVDDYLSEVLPEDKAAYIRKEQEEGRVVVMVGDGINDAPALSFADVGVAIGNGAAIAREVADITISADSLEELIVLKKLSDALMRRIHSNYRFVVGFNGTLIALGALGILAPSASALLHNSSTLLLSLNSMTKLLPQD